MRSELRVNASNDCLLVGNLVLETVIVVDGNAELLGKSKSILFSSGNLVVQGRKVAVKLSEVSVCTSNGRLDVGNFGFRLRNANGSSLLLRSDGVEVSSEFINVSLGLSSVDSTLTDDLDQVSNGLANRGLLVNEVGDVKVISADGVSGSVGKGGLGS